MAKAVGASKSNFHRKEGKKRMGYISSWDRIPDSKAIDNQCIFCGKSKSFLTNVGCSWYKFKLQDGKVVPRKKVGEAGYIYPSGYCSECGAANGTYHHFGCSDEICPVCGIKFAKCSCAVELEW